MDPDQLVDAVNNSDDFTKLQWLNSVFSQRGMESTKPKDVGKVLSAFIFHCHNNTDCIKKMQEGEQEWQEAEKLAASEFNAYSMMKLMKSTNTVKKEQVDESENEEVEEGPPQLSLMSKVGSRPNVSEEIEAARTLNRAWKESPMDKKDTKKKFLSCWEGVSAPEAPFTQKNRMEKALYEQQRQEAEHVNAAALLVKELRQTPNTHPETLERAELLLTELTENFDQLSIARKKNYPAGKMVNWEAQERGNPLFSKEDFKVMSQTKKNNAELYKTKPWKGNSNTQNWNSNWNTSWKPRNNRGGGRGRGRGGGRGGGQPPQDGYSTRGRGRGRGRG